MSHVAPMNCSACSAEIDLGAGARIGFRDCCDHCGADLHTCSNCDFHDPSAYNECRESSAERVSERERANRCDYFDPGGQTGGDAMRVKGKALGELDSLFKK
jgi:hypothetical protein